MRLTGMRVLRILVNSKPRGAVLYRLLSTLGGASPIGPGESRFGAVSRLSWCLQ